MSYRFVFVIEQGLGHVVHGINLERVLETEPDIDASLVRVRPGETPGIDPLPWVKNWSVQTSWATRRSLLNRLRARPADAIFIHTQVAALFAKSIMLEVPTVVSLDATPLNFDTMAEAYGHARQRAAIERMKLAINRRALSAATSVVTWSEWAATSVVDDYGVRADRVHAIYPGVEMAKFQAHAKDDHPGPIRVLFVGADFVRKGGSDLVEAVASLPGVVELDIVSSASDVPVPQGAPIRVHRDVKPNSAVLTDLYARADVFALPTRGDCTPLAIAEAMASGLPIVATNVGSIPDMVRNGRNGLLVPPASPGDLARALESLAADGTLRRQMGSANRSDAELDHDAAKNWRRIFDLMRSVTRPLGAAVTSSPGERFAA